MAVPALIAALQSSKETATRETIVRVLGGIGPKAKAAIPPLTECLNEAPLRIVAAAALHKIGEVDGVGGSTTKALEVLIAALSDASARPSAIWALGELGPIARAAARQREPALDDEPVTRTGKEQVVAPVTNPVARALAELLIEKRLIDPRELDRRIAAILASGAVQTQGATRREPPS